MNELFDYDRSDLNNPVNQINRWKQCLDKDIPECFDVFFPRESLFGDDQYHRLSCISLGEIDREVINHFLEPHSFEIYLNLAVLKVEKQCGWYNSFNIIISVHPTLEYEKKKDSSDSKKYPRYFGFDSHNIVDSPLLSGFLYRPIDTPQDRWRLGFGRLGVIPTVKNHLCMAWDSISTHEIPRLFYARESRSEVGFGKGNSLRMATEPEAETYENMPQDVNSQAFLEDPFSKKRIRGHRYKLTGFARHSIRELIKPEHCKIRFSFHLAMIPSSELFDNSGFSPFMELAYAIPSSGLTLSQKAGNGKPIVIGLRTETTNSQTPKILVDIKYTSKNGKTTENLIKASVQIDIKNSGVVSYGFLKGGKIEREEWSRVNREKVVDLGDGHLAGLTILVVGRRLRFRVVTEKVGASIELQHVSIKKKNGTDESDASPVSTGSITSSEADDQVFPVFASEFDDFSGLCPPNC